MNLYLNIAVIIIAVAIAILVIYLIKVLLQLKKTLQSVDELTKQVSTEVTKIDGAIEGLKETSQTLKGLTGRMGLPFLKFLSIIAGIAKGLNIVKTIRQTRTRKKENNKT